MFTPRRAKRSGGRYSHSVTITPPIRVRRASAATILGALGVSVLTAFPAAAVGPVTDLFLSEYLEGSSNNKAIEIYNGTGAAVDLSAYSLDLYSNGAATPGTTQPLTGTLADGDVLVIAHGSANAGILALADLTSTVTNFNGDDALVLTHSGVGIDSFGQVGVDPGTVWPGGGLNETLTRRDTVCAGDPDATNPFDAASEWASSAIDTVSGLGSHTANCAAAPVDAAPTVVSISPANGATGVASTVAPVVTFSEDVAVAEAFSLACDDAPIAVTVTGAGAVYTVTPTAPLGVGAECALTVAASGVTDLDGDADVMAADVVSSFATLGGVTPISAVQGTTETSPLAGQVVRVQGVVVGDYEGGVSPALRGFYLQSRDADRDSDPATSEAIFVFNGGAEQVAVGDQVEVVGTVAEYQGQTQLGSVTVSLLGTGATVTPAAVTLPFAQATTAERYEGMAVTFAQALTVTETYLLGRFNEVTVASGGKLDQPTAVVEPGAGAIALQEANNLRKIKIDDAVNAQNLDPMGRGGAPLTASNTLRGGDTVTGLSGVLTYTWSGSASSGNAWRVRPVNATAATPNFVAANARPTAAPAVGGDVKVTAFNVLNYFLTTGSGTICGPDGVKQTCRGANSAEELERQTAKLVSALVALDADVIGMAELENTPGVEPLATLADRMNAATGRSSWSYVDTGIVGTDTIRVGFLYDSAVVTEVGAHAVLDDSVDPTFDDDSNRPSVAQTFADATGETFTVVANHWKSKGSCAASGLNADQGDGAGCWNGVRTAAATALVNWLGTHPTGTMDDDYIIVGDLNSYGQEDPIDVLRDAGYVDLAQDYSYVFDGQWGSLDYAFASASMYAQVTGAAHLHINADEPTVLDYNMEFKSAAQLAALYGADMYRTSDHDPVLTGLDLGHTRVQVLGTNDFHGRILPTLGSGEAGAAVMAGAVSALESQYVNSVFTAAGDLVGASTFESFISKDKPTIDALNAMGLDVSAVGNHEFDQGFADLTQRIMAPYDAATNPFGGATWEYLGANVRQAADGSAALPETWIASFDNGTATTADDVKLGFIGVVTEETDSLVSPGGITGLAFEDEAVAANRAAAALEDAGVSSIVLLVHEGAPTTAYADAVDPTNNFGAMLADLSPSIDAVISGHTHLAYNHRVPVAEWVADADRAVKERPVVSAGQYGMNLDQLVFVFDQGTGELARIDSATVSLTKKSVPTCTASCALVGAFPADPAVQAIVTKAQADATVLGAQEVGTMDAPLYRARMATGAAGDTRGGESTLGNAVAEVQRWATAELGADIAFMNPGGLRADMVGANADGTGAITYKKAATVQPFANTLVTMTLTGAQVAAVLEEQWQPATASRPFLRLGVSEGFEYTYDATRPAGQRILQMWLDGTLIKPADSFTVTMNSFLATGGDNFTTFRSGTNKADSGRIDLNAMIDYLEEFDSLGTAYDQRAIGVHAASLAVTAGEEFTLDLTSLMFTAPQDLKDSAVEVTLDGASLGTFPVTNTLPTNTLDEHGTATVTVTIPASARGTEHLLIEGDVTGTAFAVALEVAAPDPVPFPTVGKPVISGVAKAGSVLRVTTGGWDPTPTTFTYQWLRNGVPIKGATGATYTVRESDRGTSLRVTVTGSREGYIDRAVTSNGVTVLKVWATPARPKLRVTASTAGTRLTTVSPAWSPRPDTLTYQWMRDGRPISGAKSSSYTIRASDRGHILKVRITATKVGYEPSAVFSWSHTAK